MTRTYGTHTWNGTLEVKFPNETVEWEVSIDLKCTNPGDPGKLYGPPEDCFPPDPPEFEVTTFSVFVGLKVIVGAENDIGWKETELVLGADTINALEELAFADAAENWTIPELEE